MSKYPGVIKCKQCQTVLVSFHRHDYKVCGCPNETMIDGGMDYLRCGGVDMDKIEFLKIIKMPVRRKNAKSNISVS